MTSTLEKRRTFWTDKRSPLSRGDSPEFLRYDLILAHDVISQFSPDMLRQHGRNARRMMHSESLLLWSCALWRTLRHTYDLGTWSNGGKPSVGSWVESQIRRMAGP